MTPGSEAARADPHPALPAGIAAPRFLVPTIAGVGLIVVHAVLVAQALAGDPWSRATLWLTGTAGLALVAYGAAVLGRTLDRDRDQIRELAAERQSATEMYSLGRIV